jgi:hypothetical protein
MKLRHFGVTGCLLAALAACGATPSTPPRTAPKQRYTCCDVSDMNRDYHPGDTVTLHWIVDPAGLGPSDGVELDAHLTGPDPTVAELKHATAAGKFTFAAEPLHPTGRAGEAPVSDIAIPTGAPTGYYDLVISIIETGGSTSAGSVIQVTPRS